MTTPNPLPALDREAERSRYAGRRWLNPPDVAEELAEYVKREGRLPEEWLDVIEKERKDGS